MNSDLSPKSLMDEKSLWEIYKKSRRIGTNRFNFWSTVIASTLILTQYCLLSEPLPAKLDQIRQFSGFSLNVAITVLGFLLAGFTIFATISQPDLLVSMSRHREERSGLSFLKNNFFIFIRVFIYYLFYAIFCLLIIVFAIKGGLVHKVISYSPIHREIYEFLVGSAYVFVYGGLFFLLMQLKSFIYNVHHSVMTAIRWKATEQ